jgi:thioredoxin 1
MLSPILTVISNEFKQITFVKVNVDEIPTLAQKYKVMSIPTVYIFSKNKVKDKFLGFKPREQIML